jgi:integrase
MGSLYRRHHTWWLRYSIADPERPGRVKVVRESSGTERKTDAQTLLDRRVGAIASGTVVTPRLERLTFAEAAQDVLRDYRVNGKRSVADVERHLKLHLLPFFGQVRLSAISTPTVREYITRRQAETPAPSNATVNRELAVLKRAFSLARASGSLIVPPHVPALRENNVRRGFFEAEQVNAVCRHLPSDLVDFVQILVITGWRWRSEVAPLRWASVQFDAGAIRLEPGTTKNREGRTFPFTRELRQLLERRRTITREREKALGRVIPYVFHREDGDRIHSLRRAWMTACRAAGVPGRVLHDARRTAVRNLVRSGVPERVAMMLTGHKTRSVFDRYDIVSEADLREAAKRLDAVTAK